MAGSRRTTGAPNSSFSLYLEGPRDRDILRSWASRVSRDLARAVDRHSVLLGGRQPARAIDRHRRERLEKESVTALCVLDRDGLPEPAETRDGEPGLEFFTWPRRQIESYLLVPEAMLRSVSHTANSETLERLVRQIVPDPEDEDALRNMDAKRLLSDRGPLRSGAGLGLEPSRIARGMRETELHADVRAVLGRLRLGFGIREPEFYVVSR